MANEGPGVISFSASDFHSFMVACRHGGFVIAHPGKNTFPSCHYIDELARFVSGNAVPNGHFTGIEGVVFGDVLVPHDALPYFAREIGCRPDDIPQLPLGVFLVNGEVTHSIYLPHAIPVPRYIGHELYSIMQKKCRMISERPGLNAGLGENGVQRQA